jgi:hypothetical protein
MSCDTPTPVPTIYVVISTDETRRYYACYFAWFVYLFRLPEWLCPRHAVHVYTRAERTRWLCAVKRYTYTHIPVITVPG